ncbi:unnamed protein product [Mucor hiemalis]
MKLTVPAVLALAGLVSAAPSSELFSKRQAATCDPNVLSCHWSGTVDSCCSPKYGLVVLSLQWAPGWGPNDEFTVHGLWPDTCSGGQTGADGCDTSRSSSTVATIINNANSTLSNRMNTFWPSNTGDNNKFWSHEWTKHGTCVSTLRPTCYGTSYKQYEDVIDYFEQTLDLRDTYDFFGALNKNGVSVGSSYNVETIRSAIEKEYGAKVKLDCKSGVLNEIHAYFYVRGKTGYELTDALTKGTCTGAVKFPKK